MKRALLAAPVAAALFAGATHGQQTAVLENGIRVILCPIPGIRWVGVESVYRGGFADEPFAQAAHLLEHLVCHGATPSYAPGEAMAALSGIGLANAETLPLFTHYDAIGPADRLPLILAIERERMQGLVIDGAIIAQEAPRCAAEVRFIADTPQAPLAKFALMAACEVWRHGSNDIGLLMERAAPDPAVLHALHTRVHRPGNLTLVIAGDIDAAAIDVVTAELGIVEPGPAPLAEAIDFASQPVRRGARWDIDRTGLFLWWPPPEEAADRLALSIAGTALMQRLMGDAEAARWATFAFSSNIHWPVGQLPFFIYATLRPGVEGAEEAFTRRAEQLLQETLSQPLEWQVHMGRGMASPAIPTADEARVQGAAIAPRMGQPPERGAGLIAGHIALTFAMADVCFEANAQWPDPAAIRRAAEGLSNPAMRVLTFRPAEP